MTGILGSGFGLYGYLPTVINHSNEKVLLEKKAFSIFNGRPELQFCKDRIEWVSDKEAILSSSETIIFSILPESQVFWAKKCFHHPNIKKLILEKPLAKSPETSIDLFNELVKSGKHFRISYSFLYTNWAKKICLELDYPTNIRINWSFMAHHYKMKLSTWKRYQSEGGGVIRFFGIHVIALLIFWNYDILVDSQTTVFFDDEPYKWEANFVNKSGHQCNLIIDSHSLQNNFSVEMIDKDQDVEQDENSFRMKDPFEYLNKNIHNPLDSRIELLARILNSANVREEDEFYKNLYFKCNDLWNKIEAATKIIHIK